MKAVSTKQQVVMSSPAIAHPPCSSRSAEPNTAPTQLPVLPVVPLSLPHLPASRAEMDAKGWDYVDVVFVTGDAYVDHPAFAMGILGRVLEAAGCRYGRKSKSGVIEAGGLLGDSSRAGFSPPIS